MKRVGRRPLTVASVLAKGSFVVSFSSTSSFNLVLVSAHLGTLCMGVALTALLNLTMEQIPRHRSTLMSLSTVAMASSNTLGSALGGLALLQFNYEGMWIIIGDFGIIAAAIFQFLAIDPTRDKTRE